MSLDVYLYQPQICPHCGGKLSDDETCLFSDNVTHNLTKMADMAGIYKHLWRPDELDINRAGQLIEPLRLGLDKLEAEPQAFKEYNPANGWGSYEGLVSFVRSYMEACIANPAARVSVSR